MSSYASISFPLDDDGFLSQQCPSCMMRFKVKFSREPNGKSLSFCPYCGHAGKNCWWTTEQVEYIGVIQKNAVVNPLLRDLQRDIQSLNNPSAGFTVKSDPIRDEPVHVPTESNAEMPTHTFQCCDEIIKHHEWSRDLHCIVCSQPSSMI